MRISTFNPMVIIKDIDPVVELFENLGFKIRHTKEGTADEPFTDIRMEDANGFHMDIIRSDNLPRESVTAIRMNVDNIEEGIALLSAHGFEKYKGYEVAHTESADSITMVSKSMIVMKLIRHNRRK